MALQNIFEALALASKQGPTDRYMPADIDDIPLVKYYGFVAADGSWLIHREDTNVTPNTHRFANASNNGSIVDYETVATGAWDDRANLDYVHFHLLTGV